MTHPETPALVAALADRLRARGWMMATAESCTGGLIAAACTDLAGSSDWFERQSQLALVISSLLQNLNLVDHELELP